MISSKRKAELEEKLLKKQTLLDSYYLAMENGGKVEEYRFDSGEGSQRTKYYSLKQLQEFIDLLESQIQRIKNQLANTGLVNIYLRRY